MPYESPLQIVHSVGCDKGSLSLNELTFLCTSFSKKVESLESELHQARRRAKVMLFDTEEDAEDHSKQRKSLIKELDLDAGISLVLPHAVDEGSAAKVLADAAEQGKGVENIQTYTRRRREVSTGSGKVSIASRLVSTADVSTASELVSTVGIKAKDKGKAIMQESEPLKKIKKRVQVFKEEQEQERINFGIALELQNKLDEREEVVAKDNQAHDIDWSDPVVLRYHEVQNISFFKAEVRKNMCMYLKNQGVYKMIQFKGLSYEDIRPIFERVWDLNHAFVPKDFEIEKEVKKRPGFDLQQESTQKNEIIKSKQVEEEIVQQEDVVAEQVMIESSKKARGRRKKSLARKRARETLSEESAKKQKLEDDTEKEELQAYLNIVPEDESLDIESLATKQDVLEVYRLVKERFQTASPKGYDLLLWGDLKTMIEPNEEDEIWRNQQD
ncbi:hypothetical protein Tco_0882405 [Tanacetum coccineum]